MPGVYAIVNSVSGKVYVGSTTRSFKRRWREHRSALQCNTHENPYLLAEWCKYGKERFSFDILEEATDIDAIFALEQKWLDHFRQSQTVYNMGKIAKHPTQGRPLSEEHKQKIRETKLGSKNPMYGKDFTPEHRRNLSLAHKGQKRSEEAKRKMRLTWIGRKHTEEAKQKMRLAKLGWENTSAAKPYPAFVNEQTGETISAGFNLSKLCRQKGLCSTNMRAVISGKVRSCKGWILVDSNYERKEKGKPYPAFVNLETGEVIPGGINLRRICRKRGLDYILMHRVVCQKTHCHEGWVLLDRKKRKRLKKLGKPYPAFINKNTSEIIPAGINMMQMCREKGLSDPNMRAVAKGRIRSYRGWVLLKENKPCLAEQPIAN